MDQQFHDEIKTFIEGDLQNIHEQHIENLRSLNLANIIKLKNPYLLRIKNQSIVGELIKSLIDEQLFLQEQKHLVGFLQDLAIFICKKTRSGWNSAVEGIDLEFEIQRNHYIVSIKSGPNWGNSQQIAKMRENFKKVRKIRVKNVMDKNTVAINGCCYSQDDTPDKGDYLKLCGQRFWEFTSGDERLYLDIIEPLGYNAKEKNEAFLEEYVKVINKFTLGFQCNYAQMMELFFGNAYCSTTRGKKRTLLTHSEISFNAAQCAYFFNIFYL